MPPKVSVIIPVYNAEKYLHQCLDSVINQTLEDIEIVCINDGSTDGSGKILDFFASRDSRLKVIHQLNKGVSVARNVGIDNVCGEYICFCDSDDWLPCYALQFLYDIAKGTQCDIVASERRFRNNKSKRLFFKYSLVHVVTDKILEKFIKNRHIYSEVSNKLYRTDIVKNQRFIPGICFEDWVFLVILLAKVSSYATTCVPCYFYRKSDVSITNSMFSKYKVDSYLRGIMAVYEYYKSSKYLRIVQKRMAVAVKMLINKVYKAKDDELAEYTVVRLKDIFNQGVVSDNMLPLKTRLRLWLLGKEKKDE